MTIVAYNSEVFQRMIGSLFQVQTTVSLTSMSSRGEGNIVNSSTVDPRYKNTIGFLLPLPLLLWQVFL